MLLRFDETELRNLIEAAGARAVEEAMRKVTEKPYLTTADAAALLQVTKKTITNYRTQRLLPHYRIGGRYLYNRDELMAFIEHRKVRAKQLTGLSGLKEVA